MNAPFAHTTLRAEGFTCPSCVTKIEKQVGRLDGVTDVAVRFASGRIEIDHDPALASVDDHARVLHAIKVGDATAAAAAMRALLGEVLDLIEAARDR